MASNDYIKNVRERLSSMLEAVRWTDCKFLVGTELQVVVEGHKNILSSASPVFEAMFYGDMAESQTTISIPDIQPAAFKAMLQYIYTDNIKLTSIDEAFDLYYAANKYILPNLEKICTTYIQSNLSDKTVFRACEFASMFDEKNLMDKCMSYIDKKLPYILSNKDVRFEDVQLSTLEKIFSSYSCYAAIFFQATERYVKAQEKRMESSINHRFRMYKIHNDSSETRQKLI